MPQLPHRRPAVWKPTPARGNPQLNAARVGRRWQAVHALEKPTTQEKRWLWAKQQTCSKRTVLINLDFLASESFAADAFWSVRGLIRHISSYFPHVQMENYPSRWLYENQNRLMGRNRSTSIWVTWTDRNDRVFNDNGNIMQLGLLGTEGP